MKLKHDMALPFSIRVRKPFALTHYEVRDAHGQYLFELHNAKLAEFVIQSCNTAGSYYAVEWRAGDGWERIDADKMEPVNHPTLADAFNALMDRMKEMRCAGEYFEDDDFRVVPVPGVYQPFADLVRPA